MLYMIKTTVGCWLSHLSQKIWLKFLFLLRHHITGSERHMRLGNIDKRCYDGKGAGDVNFGSYLVTSFMSGPLPDCAE